MSRKNYDSGRIARDYVCGRLRELGYKIYDPDYYDPSSDIVIGHGEVERAYATIEVKGLAAPNGWLIRKTSPRRDLFYVLVDLCVKGKPEFYVYDSKTIQARIDDYMAKHPAQFEPPKKGVTGINWSEGSDKDYKDNWKILPKGV